MKDWTYGQSEAGLVNKLAREQTKLRLLADIRVDLEVCEIEGFDKLEYLDQLIGMLLELRGNYKK